MDILNKKWIHSSWYASKSGWNITRKDALDRLAKSGDLYIERTIDTKKAMEANKDKSIFDSIEVYKDVLKYSGSEGGSYTLSPEERDYFVERTNYYKNLKK